MIRTAGWCATGTGGPGTYFPLRSMILPSDHSIAHAPPRLAARPYLLLALFDVPTRTRRSSSSGDHESTHPSARYRAGYHQVPRQNVMGRGCRCHVQQLVSRAAG
jgi:hypothetical protein